jgi:hypothetical protein
MQSTSSVRTFMKPSAPKPDPGKPPKQWFKKGRLKKLINKKNLPWIVAGLLLVFSLLMYSQYNQAKAKLNPPASNTKQVTSLVDKVSKIMILPKDETPTVITVLDAEKVRDQSFYQEAKDGDKVLVYSKKKLAILYRPKTNQIVNVAPVSVSPTGASQ